MELDEAKQQTQKQWDGDPCGAVTVKGIDPKPWNSIGRRDAIATRSTDLGSGK